MMQSLSWKPINLLLEQMPQEVCDSLAPHLELIEIPVGKVIFESHARQTHMYFPRSGLISLLYVLEDGDTSEIAMVGNEGMIGVALLVDGNSTPTRAVVQAPGEAYALTSEGLDREFKSGGVFQFMILRYTQALLAQMAQTAVCNRHHTVEKQLCRWLLLSSDRIGADELLMTQEQIARLLGVRREGVTETAGKLQDAGVIGYSRGKIRILDRNMLLGRACECYRVVKKEYDRLLVTLN